MKNEVHKNTLWTGQFVVLIVYYRLNIALSVDHIYIPILVLPPIDATKSVLKITLVLLQVIIKISIGHDIEIAKIIIIRDILEEVDILRGRIEVKKLTFKAGEIVRTTT